MAYTKKELLAALSGIDDNAIIQINMITETDDGSESGYLFDVDAIAIIAKTCDSPGEGQIAFYNLVLSN